MPSPHVTTLERLRKIDKSLTARVIRVRKRALYILQSAIGAGASYWVAQHIFDHATPFFAPIAAVIILGLSGGDRRRRALEMSLGCILGVGLGDLIIPLLGTGAWKLGLAVGIALVVASLVSKSPLVNNQVATGSILIATIMPPGASTAMGSNGPERMIDAVIGSVVGLIVVALLPSNPLKAGRHEISNVLGITSSVLQDVAAALRSRDAAAVDAALTAVRGTQGDINSMLDAAKSGAESVRISPLLWGASRRVRSLERLLTPIDNAVRNVRVLARRAVILTEDGDAVAPAQIEVIAELADVAQSLSDLYARDAVASEATEIPQLVNTLRRLGSHTSMDLVQGRTLSAYVIVAQSRSLIVDLLQVCGMSRESSLAVLAPTSQTPAYPPELWEEKEEPGNH